MKISYNWLKQFIQIDWQPEKTGELLTNLGLEIEGIEPFQSIKGGLEGVVVGQVLTCEKHPNADRLKITTVDVGQKEPLHIVCGAPNVAAGQKVPVVLVGSTLYDDNGEPWTIKKGKIRGEVSEGMICAEDELGLGQSHDGIMVLDKDIEVGTPVATLFEVENDTVFEIGLTPNRADAMSHWGVARDLKAGLIQEKHAVTLNTPSVSNFKVENRSKRITIEVDNYDLAPRYCGVTISNVKVKESPKWLQNRLKAIGLTPKNNVVDVTNYVMHELGQPLHAFDASVIEGDKIEVKTLPSGTKFTTLDDVERELQQDDLMICDSKKPLCIAGVFGGVNSGVTEKTNTVFLESAYFNPVSVRKTAKRHGLNTDASFRYERGIDPEITDYALKRAVLLIQETAGGDVTSDIEDLYPRKFEDFQVFLTFDKINGLIGEELPTETIKSILASLEIKVNNVTETGLGLTIPCYRVDVKRQADVVEEILRVYGYNNVQIGDKINASMAKTSRFEDYKLQNIVGNQLVAQGFFEMLSNSLSPEEQHTYSDEVIKDHQVAMLNPLSSDLAVLRQNMIFSGLEAIAFNANRKRGDLRLFEFGKTYHHYSSGREEERHLTLFLTGFKAQAHWKTPSEHSDFFFLKGTVDTLLQRLSLNGYTYAPTKHSDLSEGMSITLGKTKLVDFGIVKRQLCQQFDVEQDVLYADFKWDSILELASKQRFSLKDIPKYPSVRRDFALLLDESTTFSEIDTIAQKTEKKLLKDVSLFDVYEGKNLPDGKKSYAVSFIFQDEKKTLTDKQVDKIMNKLQKSFESQLNAELR